MKEIENRLEEMIRYYQENDYLDFKLIEYEKNENLVKDVLALSNSFSSGEKFIIIGLKKKENEHIFQEVIDPKDSASIQQLIHQNIIPELNIEYIPFTYEGKKLVVLIIKNPNDVLTPIKQE